MIWCKQISTLFKKKSSGGEINMYGEGPEKSKTMNTFSGLVSVLSQIHIVYSYYTIFPNKPPWLLYQSNYHQNIALDVAMHIYTEANPSMSQEWWAMSIIRG